MKEMKGGGKGGSKGKGGMAYPMKGKMDSMSGMPPITEEKPKTKKPKTKPKGKSSKA